MLQAYFGRLLLPLSRISRLQFLAVTLLSLALSLPLWIELFEFQRGMLQGSPAAARQRLGQSNFLTLASVGSAIGWYLYTIATINRLHDLDKSAWRVLGPYSAYLLAFALLALAKIGISVPPGYAFYLVVLMYGLIILGAIWSMTQFYDCATSRGDDWANRFGRAPGEK